MYYMFSERVTRSSKICAVTAYASFYTPATNRDAVNASTPYQMFVQVRLESYAVRIRDTFFTTSAKDTYAVTMFAPFCLYMQAVVKYICGDYVRIKCYSPS